MTPDQKLSATRRRRPSRFDRNPKKTIAAIVFVAYAAIDLTYGHFFMRRPGLAYHPVYHHEHNKNVSPTATWGAGRYRLCTNSLGFRDRLPREVPLTSGKYRIVFIGDSFTHGVGVDYDDTFVGRVDAALPDSKFEVLNAGTESHAAKAYYLKTRYLLEDVGFKFDELYVFFDISDVQDAVAFEYWEPTTECALERWDRSWRYRSPLYRRVLRRLSVVELYGKARSLFTGEVPEAEMRTRRRKKKFDWGEEYYRVRDRWTFDPKCWEKWGKRGLELAAGNMAKLAKLCKARGIPMAIAVYPWPAQIRQRDLNCKQATFWDQFAAEHGVGFIDLFPEFINDRDPKSVIDECFIAGDVHWNAAGHAPAAKQVLAYMRKKAAAAHGRDASACRAVRGAGAEAAQGGSHPVPRL